MSGALKIRDKSPFAEGLTVNVKPVGDRWRLQVFGQGALLEESLHDTPSEAIRRLAALAMQHFGADILGNTLGNLLRGGPH